MPWKVQGRLVRNTKFYSHIGMPRTSLSPSYVRLAMGSYPPNAPECLSSLSKAFCQRFPLVFYPGGGLSTERLNSPGGRKFSPVCATRLFFCFVRGIHQTNAQTHALPRTSRARTNHIGPKQYKRREHSRRRPGGGSEFMAIQQHQQPRPTPPTARFVCHFSFLASDEVTKGLPFRGGEECTSSPYNPPLSLFFWTL